MGATPMTFTEPQFWAIALLAALLIGISKGGFAGGVGTIATPLLGSVVPIVEAAALLLPLLLAVDVMTVAHYRGDWDRPNSRLLIPAGLVGILFGSLFIGYFANNERALKLSIGIIVLVFLGYQLLQRVMNGAPEKQLPSVSSRLLLGTIGGFTSTLAHVGGPFIIIALLPQRLSNRTYVATATIYFFIINFVKLIPYALLGLLTLNNVWVSLLLLPAGFAGTHIGYWLNERFDSQTFQIVIYILLLVTGVQLIIGRSLLSYIFA